MSDTYKCLVCGLHYYDKDLAEKCADFCKEFHGCSLEITRNSVEHQQYLEDKK